MKTNFVKGLLTTVLLALVVGLTFQSCKKKDIYAVEETVKNDKDMIRQTPRQINALIMVEGSPCIATPWNCTILPEVVVRPAYIIMIDNAILGGGSEIKNVFENDLSSLIERLEYGQQQVILSGNASMRKTFESSDQIVYIVKDGTGVSIDDFDFAIQYEK